MISMDDGDANGMAEATTTAGPRSSSLLSSSTPSHSASQYLVIPGQVIATSSSDSSTTSFLRGHGTFVEQFDGQDRLVATVCGTVHRVNKLITVIPFCETLYQGHVGDLVVGRVTSVGTSRWTVTLLPQQKDASLPLSGVHLPGGAQRLRTAQDQREMRFFLKEGDLISAEVHKVQPSDGSLVLHTRSYRYTKLENGTLIRVPPALIPRQKNHYTTLIGNKLDVLWGTNGNIWIQRKMNDGGGEDAKDMADLQEQLRQEHATTPVDNDTRQSIARLRNAIECLRLVHAMATPENAEMVYAKSLELNLRPFHMLLPENTIRLTEFCRNP
ncbi:exosome complex exonuclease [Nitzschia inconspicua]|uniref:Exosome complex exonuclease n=1 Tax=Nitzschia inconspicua TaxID=303405 RepID=A0A9K3KEY4_9STRA|nr:exosome complex exonuclease [Nitzschia inconspicua]